MKAVFKGVNAAEVKSEALVVFLFSDDKAALSGRPELDGLKKYISPRLKAGDFKGKHLGVLPLFPQISEGPDRIILVGLGEKKDCDGVCIRQASSKAAKALQDLGIEKAALLIPPVTNKVDAAETVAEAVLLGARLGMYSFDELKSNSEKKKKLQSLTLIKNGALSAAKAKAADSAAIVVAEAIQTARDLINRPANMVYPETLAAEAKSMSRGTKIKTTVLDIAAAKKRNMGAFLGVAQGSVHPGRVIIMEYKGAAAGKKPIALIGKAITFDSGGLSLKPNDGMMHMKTDMSGGAAVMAVMKAAAALELKVNLVGVIPAAENMPDGNAYRPGDVLKSMSGKTIEVMNTDAEGRLILADGLALAQQYKPARMIDLATLTGACVVALGAKCAGLMGNSDELINDLKKAGEKAGERAWPLPLYDDYFEGLKSEVADFKNVGPRYGGAIIGGLFLKQFVDAKIPWVHMDIAGPARAEKADADSPAGGTGFGVHLLITYLRSL